MSKFNNLKKGDVLSEVQFYVVEKKSGDKVQLKNTAGNNIVVESDYVNKCLFSANEFSTIVNLSKTELAEKFLKSINVALTVTFKKKIDEKEVIEKLESLYPNKGAIMTKSNFEKLVKATVKNALEGETRVLRGYHWGEQDNFGRVQVKDLEVTTGFNQRQVDPRTISELIVNNVKYIVK